MVVSLWKYRTLILRNAVNDLRNRYSGSLAGYLWNVFIPLAQILVFATVFGVLMMQRLPESPLRDSRWAYVVYLCTGLLPWNAFADTLNRGVASLVSNAGYLKKLALPEQIFVAQDACAGLLTGLVSLGVFAVFAALVAGHYPTWAWIQALPALVLLVGFAYGLGLLFSCLNVFYRDVQPLMNIVLMLWFWVTPIIYTEDHFARGNQQWLQAVLPLNPAYHYLHAFHEALFLNRVVSGATWGWCAGVAVVVNALGYGLLRRLRSEIRDVL